MMRVNVSFDGDTYEVSAIPDPVNAERIDFNRTLDSAEVARHVEKPLDDPLDWAEVTVSFQRVNPDDTGLGERLNAEQDERDANQQ